MKTSSQKLFVAWYLYIIYSQTITYVQYIPHRSLFLSSPFCPSYPSSFSPSPSFPSSPLPSLLPDPLFNTSICTDFLSSWNKSKHKAWDEPWNTTAWIVSFIQKPNLSSVIMCPLANHIGPYESFDQSRAFLLLWGISATFSCQGV